MSLFLLLKTKVTTTIFDIYKSFHLVGIYKFIYINQKIRRSDLLAKVAHNNQPKVKGNFSKVRWYLICKSKKMKADL